MGGWQELCGTSGTYLWQVASPQSPPSTACVGPGPPEWEHQGVLGEIPRAGWDFGHPRGTVLPSRVSPACGGDVGDTAAPPTKHPNHG
ncbi:hypothetical protein DV515_00019097 [Chloebia gouldiae]|uniref:Uncharacterized protein n=1 Tax=Chloebia gouldiae TaxID=44316 RepID=A0A3L8Q5P1_CHLGU|nr:hypothetical protein DV515_00019097 [Chloebia gouldiae]